MATMPLVDGGFELLPANQATLADLPAGIANRLKQWNRYKNILPNPHTRVVLAAVGGDPTTAYVCIGSANPPRAVATSTPQM
jgi:hypothetical protein